MPLKEAYPEVYNDAPELTPGHRKPGQLTQAQIHAFFTDGFIIVEDFFPLDLLDRVKTSIEVLVEDLSQKLYKAKKIKNLHKDKDFFHRLTALESEFPGACVLLHKSGLMPKAIEDLWTFEPLLNVAEQLVGPEVAGYPVWNLRTKVPHTPTTVVPWHQDNAYSDPDAIQSLIPTAWIPLLDATPENGCMQVVKGGHRTGKTGTHVCCAGGTWYVEMSEEVMRDELGCDLTKDVVTCPVPFGGFLLIQNCIPHRSLPNHSDSIRWSLDLRFQDPRKPVGFFGIKDSLPFMTGGKKIDGIAWESFHAKDRNEVKLESQEESESEFDTRITGPWMNRWEIVHHNPHVELFLEAQKEKKQLL